jgi:hypothetical protein
LKGAKGGRNVCPEPSGKFIVEAMALRKINYQYGRAGRIPNAARLLRCGQILSCVREIVRGVQRLFWEFRKCFFGKRFSNKNN